MHDPSRSVRSARGISLLALGFACLLPLGSALAAPTIGFVEQWPGISLQGWSSQANNSNPGTGGLGGVGDGFLLFSTPNGIQHNLGSASFGLEYAGDWTAAGITQVRLWLKDVGADDALEMHFALGNGSNFWHYDVAFMPPSGQWAEFVADLSSATNWSRIIGTGTFAAALQTVDRVHIRHDKPPFIQQPDPLDGDVGLDYLLLTNGVAGVPPGGPVVTRALQLAAPKPNPSRGPVSIALEVFDGAPVTLEVVDAAGRLVRRTELAAAGPGHRAWTWDGRDAAGRQTPAGYYRVRAKGPAGGMSRGLVRLD
jgi:flagellar hook capping protein FlgD